MQGKEGRTTASGFTPATIKILFVRSRIPSGTGIITGDSWPNTSWPILWLKGQSKRATSRCLRAGFRWFTWRNSNRKVKIFTSTERRSYAAGNHSAAGTGSLRKKHTNRTAKSMAKSTKTILYGSDTFRDLKKNGDTSLRRKSRA